MHAVAVIRGGSTHQGLHSQKPHLNRGVLHQPTSAAAASGLIPIPNILFPQDTEPQAK